MSDALEQLRAIRNQYRERVETNKRTMGKLDDENNILSVQIDALDDAIGQIAGTSKDKGKTPTLAGIGKYASGISLTDAILDVVNIFGAPPGLLTNDIITKLRAEGFKSTAKDFYASVYSVAHHLVGSDKIKEGKKDEKRSFMRKT